MNVFMILLSIFLFLDCGQRKLRDTWRWYFVLRILAFLLAAGFAISRVLLRFEPNLAEMISNACEAEMAFVCLVCVLALTQNTARWLSSSKLLWGILFASFGVVICMMIGKMGTKKFIREVVPCHERHDATSSHETRQSSMYFGAARVAVDAVIAQGKKVLMVNQVIL